MLVLYLGNTAIPHHSILPILALELQLQEVLAYLVSNFLFNNTCEKQKYSYTYLPLKLNSFFLIVPYRGKRANASYHHHQESLPD